LNAADVYSATRVGGVMPAAAVWGHQRRRRGRVVARRKTAARVTGQAISWNVIAKA
jgi:hypothetical protein